MTINEQYLAGFFDGEGSVSLSVSYRMRHGKINPRLDFKCQISITQTNRKILDEIQAYLGYGKVIETKSHSTISKYAIYHTLEMVNLKSVKDFSFLIKNYSHLKKKQLEIINEVSTMLYNKKIEKRRYYKKSEFLAMLNASIEIRGENMKTHTSKNDERSEKIKQIIKDIEKMDLEYIKSTELYQFSSVSGI